MQSVENKKVIEKVSEELLERLAFTMKLITLRGGDHTDLYLLNIDKKYFEPIEIPENIDPDFAKLIAGHNNHGLKTLIELRDLQIEASQSVWYSWDHLQKVEKKFKKHSKKGHKCSDECLIKDGLDMNESKIHVKRVADAAIKHLEDQLEAEKDKK